MFGKSSRPMRKNAAPYHCESATQKKSSLHWRGPNFNLSNDSVLCNFPHLGFPRKKQQAFSKFTKTPMNSLFGKMETKNAKWENKHEMGFPKQKNSAKILSQANSTLRLKNFWKTKNNHQKKSTSP